MNWTDEVWREYPLVAGRYKMRRPPEYAGEHWTKRPWLPVEIWQAPSTDPVTGELLDRSWMWRATLAGEPVDMSVVYPWCLKHPVEESDDPTD